MIKEMALGLQNRHHFIDVSKTSDWQRVAKDTYTSLYDYDDYVKKYHQQMQEMKKIHFNVLLLEMKYVNKSVQLLEKYFLMMIQIIYMKLILNINK